jgi:hypothetical protein
MSVKDCLRKAPEPTCEKVVTRELLDWQMDMLSIVFVLAVIAVAVAAFFVMNPEKKH